MQTAPSILFLGLGYVAQALARRLAGEGWRLSAAMRQPGQAPAGIDATVFAAGGGLPNALVAQATHVLVSIPPGEAGDGAADLDAVLNGAATKPRWIGYLSATSVYGDHQGGWVDETTPPTPSDQRGLARLAAEQAWAALGSKHGVATQIFRLAGIYGPGRSALDQVRAGTARRIAKPGHAFSRIHVEDAAAILAAAMARPRAGAIYNLADDAPAESAEVTAFACALLGVAPPPLIAFAQAKATLSPMGLSFWADNKRVANRLIKSELGMALRYPDYRAGLRAIAAQR